MEILKGGLKTMNDKLRIDKQEFYTITCQDCGRYDDVMEAECIEHELSPHEWFLAEGWGVVDGKTLCWSCIEGDYDD